MRVAIIGAGPCGSALATFLARQGAEVALFDLEKDPLELENLFDRPERQQEVQKLKDALLAWFQDEARTAPYLDLEARQVAQPNVPRDRAGAERSMQEYLNRKMSQPP